MKEIDNSDEEVLGWGGLRGYTLRVDNHQLYDQQRIEERQGFRPRPR